MRASPGQHTPSHQPPPGGDVTPAPRRGIADQVWLLMMLPPLFWSGNAVLGRAVAGQVPPVGLAFWRWVLGALIVLPFAWPHLRAEARVLARHWKSLLALSALGIACFNTFLYLGLRTTSAINGVMIQSAMPVLIVLMSMAFFRDRVRPLQWLGILVSLCGTVALVSHGDPLSLLRLEFNGGDLWVFTAVVAYAAYTALLRTRPPVHPLSFIVSTFLLGALMLLPFHVWESVSGHPMPLSLPAVGAVAYTAVCASILAYLCFNRVVALAGANVAGLSIHLVPVFGTLLAILLLGESAQVYHAVGIGLVFAGIGLATRTAK